MIYNCHYFGTTFVYRHYGATIQMSKTYLINDKKSNQYLSICYKIKIIGKANHDSNIKYVDSIINCRSFESIHYIINFIFYYF